MPETIISQNIENQLQQLNRKGGAFLITKAEGELNAMTIGWGTIGYIWNRPVFMVAVRPARHTYSLIEKSKEFCVSIPRNEKLQAALAFCGSKSGRDVDKFAELQLAPQEGRVLATPTITGCAWHYECRFIYRQAMENDGFLVPEIVERSYRPEHGPAHVLYYGEIVASYATGQRLN